MNKFNFDSFNNISYDYLITLDDKDYSTAMAYILKLALIRDASFYEWMILNFNEIMDKEDDALKNIESKCNFIMQFFNSKDPNRIKEYKLLNFGNLFADKLEEYVKEDLFYGEYQSLAMIANSYISYKRQLLSKEEYYELRDMFVPFGLTISLDPFESNELVEAIYNDYLKTADNNEFVLLKKIGKATFSSDISFEEIKEAISQLLVEWN